MSSDGLYAIDSTLVKVGRAAAHPYAPHLHHFDDGERLHFYHAQVGRINPFVSSDARALMQNVPAAHMPPAAAGYGDLHHAAIGRAPEVPVAAEGTVS